MTFPSYKTAARWEVLVGMKLTHWFCAVQIDSKVKEGEETFVILVAEHNISYSCGDTLMKLIKGSFTGKKPIKTTNRWVTKSSGPKREMQALVCYCVTDLPLLCQLCSFTPFMPLLNSLSHICPELFLRSTISHGMEYGQFGSAILAVSSVSLLLLPLLE